ncbi:M48 family metallopeptidase [Fluviicola sp.]|uniref:M48 family metallopeptidase n=1 Tax=Fluviicola sp. TaxID=1917219 RepID=UPI0026178411|nr:M48 family metallopeptidase [Fluviicola sp.]
MAILLFFVLFLSLVAVTAYLVFLAISYPMEVINKFTVIVKLGAIAGAGMLLVFTLKFLFKMKNHQPENRIEIDPVDEPELWSYVLDICKHTGAPKPKYIYLDPDVNAYVRYTNSWLSLIMPVKKELTIGLPLTQCLELTEFKAVLSHEFGHFAQKSMRIGSYIHTANTIIHDLIYNRDSWDNALERWKKSDIRVAFPAWILSPVIWLIRELLKLFYLALNILNSSLSREMEFNADKFAAMSAGSEAIVSSLWKLDPASDELNTIMRHLFNASKLQKYSSNLFYHYQIALDAGKTKQEEALSKLETDQNGHRIYFTTSEISKVHMYDSHPPNDEREKSVKNPFVACENDPRSPELLFRKLTKWQERLTKVVYLKYWNCKVKETTDAAEIEQIIQTENAEKMVLEDFHNTFQNRYVILPKSDFIRSKAADNINTSVHQWGNLKDDLKQLMEPVWEIEKLMEHAILIHNGTAKLASFTYQNQNYDKQNVSEGYEILTKKRNELFDFNFAKWDENLFVHLGASAKTKDELETFLRRVNQHHRIIEICKKLDFAKSDILSQLNFLQNKEEVSTAEITDFQRTINEHVDELNRLQLEFQKEPFEPLTNIETSIEFSKVLNNGRDFKTMKGEMFESGNFNDLMNQLEGAIYQSQRLEQKNLSALLVYSKING